MYMGVSAPLKSQFTKPFQDQQKDNWLEQDTVNTVISVNKHLHIGNYDYSLKKEEKNVIL